MAYFCLNAGPTPMKILLINIGLKFCNKEHLNDSSIDPQIGSLCSTSFTSTKYYCTLVTVVLCLTHSTSVHTASDQRIRDHRNIVFNTRL